MLFAVAKSYIRYLFTIHYYLLLPNPRGFSEKWRVKSEEVKKYPRNKSEEFFWLRRWDLNLTTSGLWARRATKLLYSAIFCWVLTRKGYYITLLFFCQPLFCFLCKNSYFLLFCCLCSTIICAFLWYIHVFCKVFPSIRAVRPILRSYKQIRDRRSLS